MDWTKLHGADLVLNYERLIEEEQTDSIRKERDDVKQELFRRLIPGWEVRGSNVPSSPLVSRPETLEQVLRRLADDEDWPAFWDVVSEVSNVDELVQKWRESPAQKRDDVHYHVTGCVGVMCQELIQVTLIPAEKRTSCEALVTCPGCLTALERENRLHRLIDPLTPEEAVAGVRDMLSGIPPTVSDSTESEGHVIPTKKAELVLQEWCTDHYDCRRATAAGLDSVRGVELHNNPRPVRCTRARLVCPKCGGDGWMGGTDSDPEPRCKRCGARQSEGVGKVGDMSERGVGTHTCEINPEHGRCWKCDLPPEHPIHGRESNEACGCCPRAGEYNGFGSDGPREFLCPQKCACHD